jgi:hypothetical protein
VTSAAAPKHPWERALCEAIDRYHDLLTAYVDRGGEDHHALLDRMVRRGAVFAGRPLCTSLRPQLLLRSQVSRMSRVAHLFRSAVSKARDAILDDPELLDLMALGDGERRLLEINPEFKSFAVLARLDTILSGAELSLVELNTEGAFGGSYSDRLTDLFEAFQPMRELCRERRVTPLYAGSALVGAILERGTSSAARACRGSRSWTGRRSRPAPSSISSASGSSATAYRRASSTRASSSTPRASSARAARGSTSCTGARSRASCSRARTRSGRSSKRTGPASCAS